jgi:hypothetical protein
MPLFFLHVYNRTGSSRDEEGLDLPDLDAARTQAVQGIRSILRDEVGRGKIDFEGHIDIADESGRVLATVTYHDAVDLREEGEAG